MNLDALTKHLIEAKARLVRRARRLCDINRRSPSDAEDMMAEAMADVFEAWEIGKLGNIDPVAYAFMRLKQAATNWARHQKLVRHHALLEGGVPDAGVQQDQSAALENKSSAHVVFEHLHSSATVAEDVEIVVYLDALKEGCSEASDLRDKTGMSQRELDATRKRLGTMIRNLPPDLHDAVDAVLGGDHD